MNYDLMKEIGSESQDQLCISPSLNVDVASTSRPDSLEDEPRVSNDISLSLSFSDSEINENKLKQQVSDKLHDANGKGFKSKAPNKLDLNSQKVGLEFLDQL